MANQIVFSARRSGSTVNRVFEFHTTQSTANLPQQELQAALRNLEASCHASHRFFRQLRFLTLAGIALVVVLILYTVSSSITDSDECPHHDDDCVQTGFPIEFIALFIIVGFVFFVLPRAIMSRAQAMSQQRDTAIATKVNTLNQQAPWQGQFVWSVLVPETVRHGRVTLTYPRIGLRPAGAVQPVAGAVYPGATGAAAVPVAGAAYPGAAGGAAIPVATAVAPNSAYPAAAQPPPSAYPVAAPAPGYPGAAAGASGAGYPGPAAGYPGATAGYPGTSAGYPAAATAAPATSSATPPVSSVGYTPTAAPGVGYNPTPGVGYNPTPGVGYNPSPNPPSNNGKPSNNVLL